MQTYCVGMAMSAGALILASGAAGKRYVLPNSKVMIHQGSGASAARRHSGKDVDEVLRDSDRDRFLDPHEAVEDGLARQVLSTRGVE